MRQRLKDYNYDSSKLIAQAIEDAENLTPEQFYKLLEDMSGKISAVSKEIDAEVLFAQKGAQAQQIKLYEDIEDQIEDLSDIQQSVLSVLKHFEEASSSAVRIGERLSSAENERKKIIFAENLLSYIKFFEEANSISYANLHGCSSEEIKLKLPTTMRNHDWDEISKILHILRNILYEIRSDDIKYAEKHVQIISEIVETELLAKFEVSVLQMIENPTQPLFRKNAQNLARWLHLFDGGSTLQKRFIFSVVERRMPASMQNAPPQGGGVKGLASKLMSFVTQDTSSAQLVDHLSELFVSIGNLCKEQFHVIRCVFPKDTNLKTTKMLISRIFNDPAFGIQARVDSVLRPKPPTPPLSPSDYLDALVTVREKLSSLYLMLVEYAGDTSDQYRDERESFDISMNESNQDEMALLLPVMSYQNISSPTGVMSNYASLGPLGAEGAYEKQQWDRKKDLDDLKLFLEEQVSQVFQNYLKDYFAKEIFFIKTRFTDLMKNTYADTPNFLTKIQDGSVPRLKFEKVKSITQLAQTIASLKFLPLVLSISSDTISRIVNIGRDDARTLPLRIKDIFLILLHFVTDSIFLPWAQGAALLQEKHASVRGYSNLVAPSVEYLQVVASLSAGAAKFRAHFDEVYSKPLSVQPNALTVCQVTRKQALKKIDSSAIAALIAWINMVIVYFEKVLFSVQQKNDYLPKFDKDVGIEATVVCNRICRELLDIIQACQKSFVGVNLSDMIWKPFGRQFVGILILHLVRRCKISQEGTFVLVRDLDEYYNVFALMDCPESLDLIAALREISYLYMTPAENVVKMVSEDLRHLSTNVVINMLKARADAGSKSKWQKPLHQIFAAIKWDVPFEWETKPQNNGSCIRKVTLQGPSGPITLRKVIAAKSELVLNQSTRMSSWVVTPIDQNEETVSAFPGAESSAPEVAAEGPRTKSTATPRPQSSREENSSLPPRGISKASSEIFKIASAATLARSNSTSLESTGSKSTTPEADSPAKKVSILSRMTSSLGFRSKKDDNVTNRESLS